MITLTEAAAAKLSLLMKEDESLKALRVGVQGGGCSGFTYFLEFAKDFRKNDRELKQKGIDIVVDPKSFLYLMGMEIDYIDGLQGKGFKFNNPNARRTCGCGESFSV
tara:strand:+ start:477 stop:797 length:321 start_codon:yes stop_codon:yes gene_type:complete